MAVTRYTSQEQLRAALAILDASVEVFITPDPATALSLLSTPPSGKLIAWIEAGGYNIVLLFSTTGIIAGMRAVKVKGNHYLVFTGTLLSAPVLAVPITVITHSSPKALEDYLKTIDATATVTVYADEGAVSEAGSVYRIITSLGKVTIIRGAALGSVIWIMDKGGEYVTVTK